MIKEFKKYDKEAKRTVYIKTETFNRILEETNAAVRVVPRDVDVRNQYNAYLYNCESNGEKPMSIFEYSRNFAFCSCSFEQCENASAEKLISEALGVKEVNVKYAKDYYGTITDDELEVTYHIACQSAKSQHSYSVKHKTLSTFTAMLLS